MPEQKRENESNPDAHEPGDKKKSHAVGRVLVMFQHDEPLGVLFVLLGKDRGVGDPGGDVRVVRLRESLISFFILILM